MSSIKLNISIPSIMDEFLKENPSISPSKLFQSAVENVQNSMKNNPQLMESNKLNLQLKKQIERYRIDLIKVNDFMEKKELWEEFDKDVLAKG